MIVVNVVLYVFNMTYSSSASGSDGGLSERVSSASTLSSPREQAQLLAKKAVSDTEDFHDTDDEVEVFPPGQSTFTQTVSPLDWHRVSSDKISASQHSRRPDRCAHRVSSERLRLMTLRNGIAGDTYSHCLCWLDLWTFVPHLGWRYDKQDVSAVTGKASKF